MEQEFNDSNELAKLLGPMEADSAMRNAVKMCWLLLPTNSRTFAKLREESNRLLNRALTDFEVDLEKFNGDK